MKLVNLKWHLIINIKEGFGVIVLEMMNWNSFKFIWHVLIHIRMDSLSHYRNLMSDLLHMLVRID